jgi:2-keto-4-pentenoate hydratase/2-oxohepta-3-ene-1,7-dioic acid hydratase in catechol pathway
MRVIRYRHEGQVSYGVVREGAVHPLAFSPFEGLDETGTVVDLAGVRLLAPVQPSKIVGAARNTYSLARMRGWDLPVEPEFFLKPPSSVIGPDDPVCFPPQSEQLVYEAELAVVVGQRARDVTADEAHAMIFGYTCANDVTARDLMLRDRLVARSKGFDTFCPLGPMVTTDPPAEKARILCRVNGETCQDATFDDYIFPPEVLISYVSQVMTLLPGDVLLCGSAAGVGSIKPGDLVEVEIEGIGTLRNPIMMQGTGRA